MDLKLVCRICLRIPKQSMNLFSDDKTLVHKIKILLSVKIENLDQLSTLICYDCLRLINEFYNFQKLVRNTDDDLNSRLTTLKITNGLTKRKGNTISKTVTSVHINQNSNLRKRIEKRKMIIFKRHKETKQLTKMHRDYKCGDCNQNFPTRCQLNSHKISKHLPKSICNVCGKEVISPNLSRHLSLHSAQPCRCDVCGKLYKNAETLRGHKKYNHREKKVTCEICGKAYTLMTFLTEHMKSHRDIELRQKTCQICGKKVQDLKRHMFCHTGERPYSCNYCNKQLSSSYALKVHTRLHTNERPFACPQCNSSFPQAVSLKNHLKTKHGIL